MKDRRKGLYLDDVIAQNLKNPAYRRHFDAYDLPIRLALEIATLREKKGMTQSQLAAKMGVTQQFVARLENPSETVPSLRTLSRVAKALDKKISVAFI